MSADAAAVEKSIAVLPFKIIGLQNAGETGDSFLGVGLADALITRLSSLRQCVVRPTSSVLRYGNGEADPFNAGHELGVKFVLDGHIRRAGARIRVTVQLLSVGAGATVWASQFDEDFTDVLSLEDALSTQVAEALVPQLTGDERLQLAKRGTDDAEAYETYLRGRYYWNTFTEDGFAKAITSYYRAIALDPTYAAAYTGVAEYYIWLGIYGVLPPAECFAAAKEAAAKAVELDDSLAEAHTALGLAIHTADFQWSAAEGHFRRALELNPNYATAHLWLSLQLAMEGRFDESLPLARRALELDPLTPFNRHNVGWCLYHARRFDESIEHYRQWSADEPEYGSKPAWSPDGSRLAFTSNREADDFDIYVMEADGRGPRRLTDNTTTDDEPKWSPDGGLIVYQTQIDGNFELFTDSVTALLSRPIAGTTTTGIRALAVLPLTTLGASGDEQYLGVGIADMLISKLGQLDEMTLRTPAAVRRYLGTTKTALEAGRELGVDYVLAGSVERVGDRVRASLELTGTAEGRVMWAEQFDERLTDIPALQSSISERVARALSLELTSDERRRLGKRDTEDSEAHQLYLAGRYHLGKRTAEGLRQAITNFESAIARDSRFALAHAGLADCYALLNWYVEPPPADAFARARQAALRAVEYDDNLAEAHASLAFVKFHYERDWAGAELEFRRAINLNPLYPTARHWYAFNLSAAGRHDDAIAEVRRAAELDPRSAVIATALANVLYHARRFDEAIEQCQQALRLDPGSVAAHVVLRWAYEQKGQHDAAYAVYEKERAFAGDTPTTRAKLAHVLAAAKRTAEARAVFSELLASPRQRGAVTPYEIAVIYSLLNDKDNALVWLEQAAKGHAVGFSFVRVDPHLDNLRADPRFAELLRANGFGN